MELKILKKLKFIALLSLINLSCAPKSLPENTQDFKPSISHQNFSYFGDQVSEAQFKFKSQILLVNKSRPSTNQIIKKIKKVLKFTLGQMHKEASIYGGTKIEILKIDEFKTGYFNVSYTVSGKGVFKKDLSEFEFYTPYSIDNIFQMADNKCHNASAEVNEQNFWYHWNPNTNECPLKENTDYFKSKSELKTVSSEKITYPEYSKLFSDKFFKATIFVGAISKNNTDWNPLTSSDIATKDYSNYKNFLLEEGYSSKQTSINPYTEQFTKFQNDKTLVYNLVFLETGFYKEKSHQFHTLLADSLANDSFIIYSGHSGIGRNLNLDLIETERKIKIKMNPKYQILYFLSCIPYAYYSDMFFNRKITNDDLKGSKNLDILGYGIESYLNNDGLIIMKAIEDYVQDSIKTSYQTIIKTNQQYYFGVNGDEDNLD